MTTKDNDVTLQRSLKYVRGSGNIKNEDEKESYDRCQKNTIEGVAREGGIGHMRRMEDTFALSNFSSPIEKMPSQDDCNDNEEVGDIKRHIKTSNLKILTSPIDSNHSDLSSYFHSGSTANNNVEHFHHGPLSSSPLLTSNSGIEVQNLGSNGASFRNTNGSSLANSTTNSILEQWRKDRLEKKKHASNSQEHFNETLSRVDCHASHDEAASMSNTTVVVQASEPQSTTSASTTQPDHFDSQKNKHPVRTHSYSSPCPLDKNNLYSENMLLLEEEDTNNSSNNNTTMTMQKQLMTLVNNLQASLQKTRSKVTQQESELQSYMLELKQVKGELQVEQREKIRLRKTVLSGIKEIGSVCPNVFASDYESGVNGGSEAEKSKTGQIPLDALLQTCITNLCAHITESLHATKEAQHLSKIANQEYQHSKHAHSRLEEQIILLSNQQTSLEKEIERLKCTKRELEDECELSQRSLHELHEDILKKEKTIQTLDEAKNKCDARIEDLKNQAKQYSDNLSRLQSQMQTSQEALTNLETSYQQRKKEIQCCVKEKHDLTLKQAEVEKLHGEVIQQRQHVEELQAKCHEEYTHKLNKVDESQSNADKLMADALQMKEEVLRLREENKDKVKQLESREQSIIFTQRELDTQREALESSRAELDEERVLLQKRQEAVKEEEEQVKSVQEHLLDMQNTQLKLESEQQVEKEDLEQRTKELNEESESLRVEQKLLRENQSHLQTKISALTTKEEELCAIDDNLTLQRSELLKKQKDIEKNILEVNDKERHLEKWQCDLDSMQAYLEEKNSVFKEEKDEFKRQQIVLNDLQSKLKNDEIKLEQGTLVLKKDKAFLEQQNLAAVEKENMLKKLKDEFEVAQRRLNDNNEKLKEELKRREKMVKQQEDTFELSMREKEDHLHKKATKLERNSDLLSSREIQVSNIERKLSLARQEWDNKLTMMESSLEQSSKKLEEKTKSLRNMEEKRIDAETQFQSMQNESLKMRTRVQEEIKSSQDELKRLHHEVEAAKESLREMKVRIKTMKGEEKKNLENLSATNKEVIELENRKDEAHSQLNSLLKDMEASKLELKINVERIQEDQKKWEGNRKFQEEEFQSYSRIKQTALENHLSTLRENTKRELKQISESYSLSFESALKELNLKSDKLEKLHEEIQYTTSQVREQWCSVQSNKAVCDLEREKLDKLLESIGSASENDKAKIAVLEKRAETLQKSLETERLEQTRQRYIETGKLKETIIQQKANLEEEHRISLDSFRTDSNKKIIDLQTDKQKLLHEISILKEKIREENESFEKQKESLQDSIQLLEDKLHESRRNIEENAKRQREKDVVEANKIDHLLKGIEDQSLAQEKKEKDLDRRESLLLIERKKMQTQLEDLSHSRKVFQQRSQKLKDEESLLSRKRDICQEREEVLSQQTSKLAQASRTFALQRVFYRSQSRTNYSVMSQAFFRWFRFTTEEKMKCVSAECDDKIKKIENYREEFAAKNDHIWSMKDSLITQREGILLKQEEDTRLARKEVEKCKAEYEKMRTEVEERRKSLDTREQNLFKLEQENKKVEKELLDRAKQVEEAHGRLNAQLSKLKEEQAQNMQELRENKEEMEVRKKQADLDRSFIDAKASDLDLKAEHLDDKEKKLELLELKFNEKVSLLERDLANKEIKLNNMEKEINVREAQVLEKQAAIEKNEKELYLMKASKHQFSTAPSLASSISVDRGTDTFERLSESTLREKEILLQRSSHDLDAKIESLRVRELDLNRKCENLKMTQARVKELALQLKKKDDEISRDRFLLNQRLKKCDECEDELKLWQQQLDHAASCLKKSRETNLQLGEQER